MHQFCLAGLPELLAVEVLCALQRRDLSPPPIDPSQVRILLTRVAGAVSLREADPAAVCESGGTLYNSTTRGLFRDLRHHLDRAWAQLNGTDPTVGDLWQVALLDLHAYASRPWATTHGVVDFRPIEPPWLREIVKDWARASRPYLQRLGGGSFSRRTASPDKLHIDVTGVGPLTMPVSAAEAKQLSAVARPAQYGQGERTLTDATVRYTWQVPSRRVRIDKRQWNRTLAPILEGFRVDLGLPEGSRLKAELHSLLVYSPGQFFLPHQD